ncbi:DNA adenine methylase [Lonepinella koalarum]
MKTYIPPIKSQGIKTKLVPFISQYIPKDFDGVWIEPFLGTGVVAFNLAPNKALLCDSNPHLIQFYQAIQNKQITPNTVRNYLQQEGDRLLHLGEQHYYFIRDRFNATGNSLDFLFLNRAGFNGMIRFNRKGEFNIPFCRKTNRFSKAYITKIVNQVDNISQIIHAKKFTFICQDYQETIASAQKGDLIYCDPPYIDRHADYFNSWTEKDELQLYHLLKHSKAQFILSTWSHNRYRTNYYLENLWKEFYITKQEHFYHVGAKESNRNSMIEAMISNFEPLSLKNEITPTISQLPLLLNIEYSYVKPAYAIQSDVILHSHT